MPQTNNYAQKYISSGNPPHLTDSLIFDDGTKVAIGTTSPVAPLTVVKTTSPSSNNFVASFRDSGPAAAGAVVEIHPSGYGGSDYANLNIYNASDVLTSQFGPAGEFNTTAFLGTHQYTVINSYSTLNQLVAAMGAFQSDIGAGGTAILVRDNFPSNGRLWVGMSADTNSRETSVITAEGSLFLGSAGSAGITAPNAPTVATGASGVLNGTYRYKYTYVTNDGETDASPASNAITPSNQRVTVTVVNGPTGTIAKRIYRTAAGGSTYRWIGTIANNTTTTYDDNRSDTASANAGGFGGLAPTINTTVGGLITQAQVRSYNGMNYTELKHDGTNTTLKTSSGAINFITQSGTGLTVDSSARVGIGTSPAFQFDVRGGNYVFDGSTGTIFLTQNAGSTSIAMAINPSWIGTVSAVDWTFRRNNADIVAVVASGLQPNTDNTFDLGEVTSHRFRSGYFSSALVVGYTSSVTGGVAAFNGNVGIGTTSPSSKLHVFSASNDDLVYGANPRFVLKTASGVNGFRIVGDTTPFQIQNSADTTNSLTVGNGMDTTWSPSPATSGSTLKNSPQLLLTGSYWNGSTSINRQGLIYFKLTSTTSPFGGLSLGTTLTSDPLFIEDVTGNVGFNGSSFGGGIQIIFIANATTVPSSNPSGGGVLYVDSGALKYRGSSGAVTTLAPA